VAVARSGVTGSTAQNAPTDVGSNAAINLSDDEREAAAKIIATMPEDPQLAFDTAISAINMARTRRREALHARIMGVSVDQYRALRDATH